MPTHPLFATNALIRLCEHHLDRPGMVDLLRRIIRDLTLVALATA